MIAIEKRVSELTAEDERRLLRRGRAADPDVEHAVASIIHDVRARDDDALHEMADRYDGVVLDSLEVPRSAVEDALDSLAADVAVALRLAADRIAAFHRAQLPTPVEVEVGAGVRLGRRFEPLNRVGVYAPGGRAAYPSSVLMGAVPARVAGVDQIVVCSPPGPGGRPSAAVLAACAVAGADRVFAVGGAGAIAALAFGTASIPRADKVVGPGNAYVNEAKRQLTGAVAVDTPAGPSELLVIADAGADADRVAVELLAQAEHDPDAAVALVATCDDLVRDVRRAIETRLPRMRRREIVRAALASAGALLRAADTDEAFAFAERYAPEHLLLAVREPRRALERVRAAGTVFLGQTGSVALGDYVTGANHVLPTGGRARAHAGLSTTAFLRASTYQVVSPEAAVTLATPAITLAEAEGLPGHAAAAVAAMEGAARAVGARSTLPTPPAPTPPASRPADDDNGNAVSAHQRHPAPAAATAIPLRPAYHAIEPYEPDRRPVEIDLSDNTNRFGTHPAAVRALSEAAADEAALTRYPTVYADRLTAAIARRHGVSRANVVTGCGSDDVIDAIVRAFCEPGDAVVYPVPTFGMVPVFARMNAARPVAVPLGPELTLDRDTLAATRARVVYICRPNNPTGTMFDGNAVRAIAERASGIVVIDEAYGEYAGESLAVFAADSDRTVVIRTLSKAFGLAALRVGYAIGPIPVVDEIRKSRGPYKVSAPAEAAAEAALTAPREWLDRVVARTRSSRHRLAAALAARGFDPPPSAANFVLIRCPGGISADDLAAGLRIRGIAVRAFTSLPRVGDAIRVTVGPWPLMQRFLDALDDALTGRTGELAPSGGSSGR